MLKRLLSLIIAVIIVMGAVICINADTISELESEQKRLEQEAREYEEQLAQKEGEIEKQEEYIATLTAKITNINDQIVLNREKIAYYETEIAKKEDEKEALNREAEEGLELLRKRLCSLYKAGEASTLEIILGAGSFSDFVDSVQLVESIAESDAKLIDDIETQLDSVNEVMATLSQDKAKIEEERTTLQANQDELNALLEENQEALATLYGEKKDIEELHKEREDAVAEIDQKIEDYYEEQKRLEQERLEQQQGGNSGGTVGPTPEYTGSYVWPVPGFYWRSSEYYEERTGYYHGGIDIAGPGFMGATVVAAASGTVIDSYNGCTHNWGKYGSCGCGGGFGNYVWIDHGGGKATIYAHLSYNTIYVGQYVSAGEVIGYGGSTGYSTGPHLHFECRYYGEKYDPRTELGY
ncbi:MAG: hypothetical protein E7566_05550 [Ruminococcaceae bacterium]|nr:hypothetical protein [Oscillospiraceae bacterium]